MRTSPSWRRLVIGLALTSLVAPLGAAAEQPDPSPGRAFSRAGIAGSGRAQMQPVNVPARVGRVAVVPGSKEFWALGLSRGALPGWDAANPGGQVIFLKGNRAGQWDVAGPPLDAAGKFFNPTLAALSMARGGEGFAVGADGVILHHRAGTSTWSVHRDSGSVDATLSSVSIGRSSSGALYGYAAGDGQTILRYADGRWTRDGGSTAVVGDVVSVSALSANEAWAVSRSTNRSLLVWRRTNNVWQSVQTGDPMFDSPPASAGCCTVNKSAQAAVVAATATGAWVGGIMYPVEASSPFSDALAGDPSRPFVVWFPADGSAPTSYCPDQYSLGEYQSIKAYRLCDRPFPMSAFDVTSLAVFPGANGGEVFAGGLGLFHFRDGGWFREPDVNGYLISVAFASPTEGWTASTGNTYGAGGAVYSSTSVLGHWTASPAEPMTARWAQPNQEVLESTAIAPDGVRAVAVGQNGGAIYRDRDGVWNRRTIQTDQGMHAIAWPGGTAWAVGGHGIIVRFSEGQWHADPASEEVTNQPLFGLAFREPTDGVAVGRAGTILRYDGKRWRHDAASGKLTRKDLYSVAVTREGYIAVGADGTVVVVDEGGWRPMTGIAPLVTRGGRRADLYAASTAGDDVVIGGALSTLLVGDTKTLRPFEHPVEGTVVAVAAARTRGTLRIMATVSEEAEKFLGDRLAVSSGALLSFDGTRWRDAQLASRRTVFSAYEPSAPEDPVLGMVFEASGTSGWAVGGRVPNALDPGGHMQTVPTSSIYRFDLHGDPTEPGTGYVPPLPKKGTTFAFFGETGCERAVCGATVGSGIKADVIAQQIRRDVDRLSKMPGGPKFALFGGNMRRLGIPEEIAQFRGFLESFDVPVFGALGDQDLFQQSSVPTPDGSVGGIARSFVPSSNLHYLRTFGEMPAPWGTGAALPGFKPVSVVEPGSAPGQARTHYAFDHVSPDGETLRVAVIDSSQRSLAADGQNPQEDQLQWLTKVLGPARLAGIPSIVVMNQPTFNTVRGYQQLNWRNATDAVAFHGSLITNGVSGVFASGIKVNLKYSASQDGTPGSVPIYVHGAAGAPLEESRHPLDGFYHAWQLVNIDDSQRIAPLNQARVTVSSIPLIDTLALDAEAGREFSAGSSAQFTALARSLWGGTSDIEQANAVYLKFPQPVICSAPGLARGSCAGQDAVHPIYKFWTDDPSIADVVVESIVAPGVPLHNAQGKIVRSTTSGFVCTYKPGRTYLNIAAGLKQARVPIDVSGGSGPCQPTKQLDPPKPDPPIDEPVPNEPQPEAERPQTFRARLDTGANVVLAPIPAPVVAPAPPGAPGVGRKEEHEASHETEGHGENKHTATALVPRPRRNPAVESSWLYLGAVALLALMSAAGAATIRQGRPSWERERQ